MDTTTTQQTGVLDEMRERRAALRKQIDDLGTMREELHQEIAAKSSAWQTLDAQIRQLEG